ncbi:MAG TPA: TIGR00159 family protein, partial [Thermoanaerobaculia bacterium]|nr:TIGR00159 family protein [Thermoanaerobaculia bacterium]
MNLPSLLELVTWRDLLDVGVVALLFYNLLLLIRGTRAVQMLSGLLFAALLFFVARTTGLLTLEAIIEKVLIFLPFAIIVLFQQ